MNDKCNEEKHDCEENPDLGFGRCDGFAPVAASSAPVAVERQTAVSEEKSELGGAGLIIAILVGLTAIGGMIITADDDNTPVSV